MGTPDFAVASLKAIHKSGYNIVGVITAPDRAAGRGLKVQASSVKQYALDNGLNILQPTNLKSETFLRELKDLNADLQIVVAFRMLPEIVWNMPPLGSINLHASLLPEYRGAAPINWAIINQEIETGVTTFFIRQEIDTGDILMQESCSIDSLETAGSLHDKLMILGANTIVKTIKLIAGKGYKIQSQSANLKSKKAPKIFKDDCRIKWDSTAKEIDHFIRGLQPYPVAWTSLNEKSLRIYKANPSERNTLEPGELSIKDKTVYVGTGTFDIELIHLQIEGKKRMSEADFINGFRMDESIILK